MTSAQILVADDQPDVLQALRLLLKAQGHQAHCVNTPAQAIEAARKQRFDAALIDLNYSRDTTSGG